MRFKVNVMSIRGSAERERERARARALERERESESTEELFELAMVGESGSNQRNIRIQFPALHTSTHTLEIVESLNRLCL